MKFAVKLAPKYLPLAATVSLFLLMAALGSLRYTGFFSAQVFANLLIDNAFLCIVAIGMTFVILSGGIDLSVGSVIALTTRTNSAHPSASGTIKRYRKRGTPRSRMKDNTLGTVRIRSDATCCGMGGRAAESDTVPPRDWSGSQREV